MPGNNMKTLDNHQTQVNNEAQQKQEKIVCYNPKDETWDKTSVTKYGYKMPDFNQTRDFKIMSEKLNLVPDQDTPPEAKSIENQETREEQHINHPESHPRINKPNTTNIVEEAKETVCQQQPLEVHFIKHERMEDSFESTRVEVEDVQQNEKDILFQQKMQENKRIEDQLLKVRIIRKSMFKNVFLGY